MEPTGAGQSPEHKDSLDPCWSWGGVTGVPQLFRSCLGYPSHIHETMSGGGVVPDTSPRMSSNARKGKMTWNGSSFLTLLALLPPPTSSRPSRHPQGLGEAGRTWASKNLSLEVLLLAHLPSARPPRAETMFPTSLAHPHFPRCFPKRFKLDPVPLQVSGMTEGWGSCPSLAEDKAVGGKDFLLGGSHGG